MKDARPRKRDRLKILFRRTKEEEGTNAADPDPEATSIEIYNDRAVAEPFRTKRYCSLFASVQLK